MCMSKSKKDIYKIPQIILIFLAGLDFLRGFMHTFAIHWAAENIARLDLSQAAHDQLWLLGTFGISNFLTGSLFLLIAFKARHLSPWVLILIPATYALGAVGFKVAGLERDAAFNGFYFMVGYLTLCLLGFGVFAWQRYIRKRS